MEKTLAGIASMVMGIMGGIFLIVGLINVLVFPESVKIIGAVFAVIGVAFLIQMLVFLKLVRRAQSKSQQLMLEGRKVEAKILEIKENRLIRINRKHPYVVICEAEGHIFESEYFYNDVHRFDDK